MPSDPPTIHATEEMKMRDGQAVASAFREELEKLVNCHSLENGSATPDFILAQYLVGALALFDQTVRTREKWYGRISDDNAKYGPAFVAGPSG